MVLITLRDRLVKIGAWIAGHGLSIAVQMAEFMEPALRGSSFAGRADWRVRCPHGERKSA